MSALEQVRQKTRTRSQSKVAGLVGTRHEDAETKIPQEKPGSAFKPGPEIDIGQLTWEDKERVLRLLFAQMNGLIPEVSDQAPPKK